MVKQIKWTERKFDFNLPAGVFPALLERMLGTAPRLEEMVKGLEDEALALKHGGGWSVKEHIGHLSDLERLHETRLDEILAGKENLTAADMSNKATNEAAHNSKPLPELISEFRRIRKSFVIRLAALDEETIEKSGMHPRLNKPMRIIDIAYFTSEHDDHHLAIIRRIITA